MKQTCIYGKQICKYALFLLLTSSRADFSCNYAILLFRHCYEVTAEKNNKIVLNRT